MMPCLEPGGSNAAARVHCASRCGYFAVRRARATVDEKIPRVGVLWHAGSAEEEAIYLAALEEGLRGLGYIDGKTIALEHRFPNEIPERFVSLAAELAALKPEALVAV